MSGTKGLSVSLNSLLDKMKSTDSDLRLMALIDLNKDLVILVNLPDPAHPSAHPPAPAYTDSHTEELLTSMVLSLLDDTNAEVKNKTVECLANMSKKTNKLKEIIEVVLAGLEGTDDEKRDICCLAIKSLVLEMRAGKKAPDFVATIATRCLAVVGSPSVNPQSASELLQVLAELFSRFDGIVARDGPLQARSLLSLATLLSTARPSIRKRAIPALSALVASSPGVIPSLSQYVIDGLKSGDVERTKTWVAAVASLAKGSAVADVGALIEKQGVASLIMGQLSDLDDSDTVEGALVAFEVLVLRCPTEMSPHLEEVTAKALELIKYDPNYVDLDDDDDVDMDEEDDEDDDFDDAAYSDDEDVSWKIRRAAAKILIAAIGTRHDLLADFYRTTAPTLISRFNEREESVRLEVLAAFDALLRQTVTARAAEIASGGSNKRKRAEEMDQDVNESALASLYSLRPQLVKGLVKQTNSKSVNTRQQVFVLLREVVEALDGGLEADGEAVCTAAQNAFRTSDSTTPSLTIAVLAFLAAFFTRHSAKVYTSYLAGLTPAIVRCMRDKLQRVNFEAFAAASALAQAVRPIDKGSASPLSASYATPVKTLFDATVGVLADASVDADVREKALITLGNLLVHEGDSLEASYGDCLPLITARLGNENTATTAVQVIGRVAESLSCKGPVFDQWLLQTLPEIVVALRRNKRSASKSSEFTCLQNLLTRIGTALPTDVAQNVVADLGGFSDTPAALQTLSIVLTRQPASRAAVDEQIMPRILEAIKTPSINAFLVDALVAFLGSYVAADVDSATRLVPVLVDNLGKVVELPDATRGGTSTYTTTAKCIGAVVAQSKRNQAGVVAVFQKTIQSTEAGEADVYLALLCVGETGRASNLSPVAGLYDRILQLFQNESEEVRSAAAFAAGNLAVGAPGQFLPVLVKHLTGAQDGASRVLLLHAFKEVILHTSAEQLEALAETLWNPLFAEDSGSQSDVGDDGVRNVKAACIGKLTTAAPSKFLPQLQKLLKSTPRDRAIVAASVRYTFIDTSTAYDDYIAPIIGDFLALMKDENLIVRRLSLASLNAAVQNKPHLIIDKLGMLQPYLYAETEIKPELQRDVQMGPFKVVQDDGVENRKAAYETMYTMLGTCFNKIDLPTFTERVMAALRDEENEVKVLGLMLLLRLGKLASATVIARLDDVTESLQKIMKDLEVKEDTVRQDLERKEEMQRSALRTAIPLFKMSTPTQAPAFHAFITSVLRNDKWKDYRDYQA